MNQQPRIVAKWRSQSRIRQSRSVGIFVGWVAIGVSVRVGVKVSVGVGVLEGIKVGVCVGGRIRMEVGVGAGVKVRVRVGMRLGVGMTVPVWVAEAVLKAADWK
jgi:hypothetical protein